jgi:hypothetical protein
MKHLEIIPLGEECYTCESIDSKFNKNGIRQEAYPFDYVGHTFVKSITNKIKNGLDLKESDISIQLFGDNYFYVDNVYGFNYWHDTTHKTIEEFTSDEMNTFLNKYNRRYTRLRNKLNENVLFLSVNHFDKVFNETYDKESIVELAKHLNGKKLLAINHHHCNMKYENITFLFLPVKKNGTFEKSKLEFKKTLFEYINNLNYV